MILGKIDYKLLRSIDPVAARTAVLEYLKTNDENISTTAKVFGINRTVVYDILRKKAEGDLSDRSKAPKYSPNKVSSEVEDKVGRWSSQRSLKLHLLLRLRQGTFLLKRQNSVSTP